MEASLINKISVLFWEPFLLKDILNPFMIPRLESGEGSCQDTMITEDVLGVTVRLLGAFGGPERFQIQQGQEIRMNFAHGK